MNVTPHVAQNQHERRTSAIDERTTRHEGYVISQRKRKRVEEIFGWIKTIAGLRKTRHRGDLPRLFQPVITEDFRTAANSFGVR